LLRQPLSIKKSYAGAIQVSIKMLYSIVDFNQIPNLKNSTQISHGKFRRGVLVKLISAFTPDHLYFVTINLELLLPS
jgi:hypothetical protein